MIRKTIYDGFEAVEIATKSIKAVLVYEIGPRIAHFGKIDGENLLYWNKTEVTRGNWKLYGGHRVWLTRPFADESEDTYIADNDPCNVQIFDNKVIATTIVSETNCLQRGMEIEIVSENELRVRNFVKNCGNLIYSGGVWSPTCINPVGKKMIIPLGDKDASWDVVKIAIPLKFAGNETILQDEQAEFDGNNLIVTPLGRVLKRVCLAKQGKVILDCGNYSFVKFSKYNKLLKYPFDGCNTAVFVGNNNFMGELETYGGESEICPNETIDNVEIFSIE